MKKVFMIIAMFMVVTSFAQEKSKKRKVDVEVNGNCEMCKARIEKAAFKVKGVKSAEWHAGDQKLHLMINEYKTDVLTIQTAIAAIGHDTAAVKATDEAYNGLHGCCKYERKATVKESCAEGCAKSCCTKKEAKSCASKRKSCKTACASK